MKLPIEKIGNKIRTLRKQQSQTLEDMSKKTGLSKGLLSQVERGISQPSLETLWKITKALDASIISFFEDVSGVGVQVTRKEQRNQLVFPGMSGGTFYNLYQGNQPKLHLLEILLLPGEVAKEQFATNGGEQLIIVTAGVVGVLVEEQEYVLFEGDSIYFESFMEYSICNQGEQQAKMTWLVIPKKL
jgi:transcriptional regulator with XRE-family HTH domain